MKQAVTESISPARCAVVAFPGAATKPVINPKRGGRLPRDIVALSARRLARLVRARQEAEAHAQSIQKSMLVQIRHRESKNFGRVARVLSVESNGIVWIVPLGGPLLGPQGPITGEYATIDISWIEPQAQAAIR